MKIEIARETIGNSKMELYSVSVDGYTILECLSEAEVNELTIADIIACMNEDF